jgi:hypothetical protein
MHVKQVPSSQLPADSNLKANQQRAKCVQSACSTSAVCSRPEHYVQLVLQRSLLLHLPILLLYAQSSPPEAFSAQEQDGGGDQVELHCRQLQKTTTLVSKTRHALVERGTLACMVLGAVYTNFEQPAATSTAFQC